MGNPTKPQYAVEREFKGRISKEELLSRIIKAHLETEKGVAQGRRKS